MSGGRLEYLTIIASACTSFFLISLKDGSFKLKFKHVILVSILSISVFSFISMLTNSRLEGSLNYKGNANQATKQQIITYTGGAIAAFDYSLKKDYVKQIGGYGYGLLSFSAIENIVYSICNKIGFPYERKIIKFTKIKQGRYIPVGNGKYMNALYTWNLWFYTDFGIIGCIILPFLIGYFFRSAILFFYKFSSVYMLILVDFISWKVCYKSVMDSNISMLQEIIFIIIMISLARRYKTSRIRIKETFN